MPIRKLVFLSVTQDTTANQRLAGVILDRPLAEYVAEKRSAIPQWPWRLIAKQLATDTEGQVSVSHTALRRWYGDDVNDLESAAS